MRLRSNLLQTPDDSEIANSAHPPNIWANGRIFGQNNLFCAKRVFLGKAGGYLLRYCDLRPLICCPYGFLFGVGEHLALKVGSNWFQCEAKIGYFRPFFSPVRTVKLCGIMGG